LNEKLQDKIENQKDDIEELNDIIRGMEREARGDK